MPLILDFFSPKINVKASAELGKGHYFLAIFSPFAKKWDKKDFPKKWSWSNDSPNYWRKKSENTNAQILRTCVGMVGGDCKQTGPNL